MKKLFILIFLINLTTLSYSQEFGVGMQSSTLTYDGYFTHGISGKMKFNDNNTIQAVISVVGPYSSYTGRFLYGFNKQDIGRSLELEPFLFGMGTLHSIYRGAILGAGVGAGIEWNLYSFEDLGFSQEISYSTVSGYGFMQYGFGLHYYFE